MKCFINDHSWAFVDIHVLMLTQDFVFQRIRVTFAWFLDMLHTAIPLEYFKTLITLISANFKISFISIIREIRVSPAGPPRPSSIKTRIKTRKY